ncbi:MAG: DNA-processing protein DprA [Pseudomonadota bacterium]
MRKFWAKSVAVLKSIDHDERLCRLQLYRSVGIGPLTYRQLLGRYGSAKAALEALPQLAEAKKRRGIKVPDGASVAREFTKLTELGGKMLTLGEEGYPTPLTAVPDAPPVLTIFGDPALLTRDCIAIVGARNASAAGRRFARQLAEDLGEAGFVITSGLARGIDGAAHEAALPTGTVAVLAGGADSIYPPEHAALYRSVADQGAVISEQPLGMTGRAKDFPKRNRIVSGLSRGVVVVEAAERSGTLITARLAAEQGREVFAVPGSPLDPRCAGTNSLLRRGAVLLRSAEDVITELETGSQALFEPSGPEWTDEDEEEVEGGLRDQLLELLSFTPTHKDTLIAEAAAAPGAVALGLLELVLEGTVLEDAGGTYVLSAETV